MPSLTELLKDFDKKNPEEAAKIVEYLQKNVDSLHDIASTGLFVLNRVENSLGLIFQEDIHEVALFIGYLTYHIGDLRSIIENDPEGQRVFQEAVHLLKAKKFKDPEAALKLIYSNDPDFDPPQAKPIY